MHDWKYESLIRHLKAALAEAETEPDPSTAPFARNANDLEVPAERASTSRRVKRAPV